MASMSTRGKEQDMTLRQYIHHNAKKDFFIDLDNVYEWLGFAQKAHAVAALDFLVQDIHYKIVLRKVLLTVNGFKRLCIAANTDKARRVLEHTHQMMDDQRAIDEATAKKVWG